MSCPILRNLLQCTRIPRDGYPALRLIPVLPSDNETRVAKLRQSAVHPRASFDMLRRMSAHHASRPRFYLLALLHFILALSLIACSSDDDVNAPDASDDASEEDAEEKVCVELAPFSREERAPTPEEIAYCPKDAAAIRARVEDALQALSIEE